MSADPAFSERLTAHAAWLRQLAASLASDPAAAEDLVQDTWAAAWAHGPGDPRPLRPWLGTIARRLAWKRLRARAPDLAGSAPERADGVPGPDELAEKLEGEKLLVEELGRLEEPFRATLFLRFYEGLEPIEIARRTGAPPGTVRWRLHRALELLRARLDDRHGGRRSAWLALLVPLGRPPAAAALPPATLFSGALAMNAFFKLALPVAAVAVVALGLRASGVLTGPARPVAAPESPSAVALLPVERPGPPAVEDAAPAAAAPGEGRTLVEASAPAAPTAAAPEAAAPPARIEAQAVDGYGRPLLGAHLFTQGAAEGAAAGPDGRLALELPFAPGETGRRAAFELSCAGWATRVEHAWVEAGATAHLGRIELSPGGAVRGVALDAERRPVAGARIGYEMAERSESELELARFRPPALGTAETATGADGAFTLSGVPTGPVRIWAFARGYRPEFSAPVAVEAGSAPPAVELTLAVLPSDNAVPVRVVDPEGAPVPRARLSFQQLSSEGNEAYSDALICDESGRHEFVVPADARMWITARDPEGRFASASALDYNAGAGELLLRLSEPNMARLIVREPGGEPLERFALELRSADGQHVHQRAELADHPGGEALYRVPESEFLLTVSAPLHAPLQLKLSQDEWAGKRRTVELTPVPGIHGIVTGGGAPLAGARVELFELVEEDVRYEKNGFPCWCKDVVLDRAEADAEGRFALAPPAEGRYVIRAEAAGWAPGNSAFVDVGPELSGPAVEVALGAGGALEGRVRGLGDPSGTIVGISRGDGHGRTVRVGPDGAYRFTGLTAGGWSVVRRAEEIYPDWTHVSTSPRHGAQDSQEPEWDCIVEDGGTTFFDVRVDAPAVLSGTLRAPGAELPFVAHLVPPEDVFESDGPSAPVDESGTFRLEAPSPGSWSLVLRPIWEFGEQMIVIPVELAPGENAWTYDLSLGALVVEDLPAWDGDDFPTLAHVWTGRDGAFSLTAFRTDGHGSDRVLVPAGESFLARPDPEHEPKDWPVVKHIRVTAGAETRVKAP